MFFLYLLFFINLLHKAKRKWNFLISSCRKYYKEGATVITQFLTIFILIIIIILFTENDKKWWWKNNNDEKQVKIK
jgi:hypothetical protein